MKDATQQNQKELRYPGVVPFQPEQKDIFFGRDQEEETLFNFIGLNQLTVLYAKSGMGKTSLLNAGIIPAFKNEGDFRPVSIRFHPHYPEKKESPGFITRQFISERAFQTTFLDTLIPDEPTLWHDVKEQQILAGGSLSLVLIFDQFEELFTYPETDIRVFKEQLAELLYTNIPQRYRHELKTQQRQGNLQLTQEQLDIFYRPFDLRVVFSIRSDRMHHLNRLGDYIPGVLKHCYELQPLTPEQAKEAILKPAQYRKHAFSSPTFEYDPVAVDTILTFLTQGDKAIESFQLQMICNAVEQKVMDQQLTRVTVDDLGDLNQLIEKYYQDKVAALGEEDVQARVRRLMEEGLAFENEQEQRRLSLFEGQILKEYDLSPEQLAKLVDSRLVRAVPLADGGYAYELSHDSLLAPILNAKKSRKEAERLKTQAAEASKREKEAARKRRNALLWSMLTTVLGVLFLVLYLNTDSLKKEVERQKSYAEAQLIEVTKENIRKLDYALALNRVTDLVEEIGANSSEAKNITFEVAYYLNESYGDSLESALRTLSRVIDQNKSLTTAVSDFPSLAVEQRRAELRNILFRVDSTAFLSFENKYYPEMIDLPLPAGGNIHFAKTETTVWQYNIYCQSTGEDIYATSSNWGLLGDYPVVKLDWYDVIEYANWLSERQGYTPVYNIIKPEESYDASTGRYDKLLWSYTADSLADGYRLPTEAEWAYAAAYGQPDSMRYAGSDTLAIVGWYMENSLDGVFEPRPVGLKQPNRAGLYDMSGNVWEWCEEWWMEEGEPENSYKTVRGGAFNMPAEYCTVTFSDFNYVYNSDRSVYNTMGFRLCRSVRED